MKENESIAKLFKDLFEGSPWIDVNILDTLKNLTAENAAKKLFPNQNSIWEIVNHIISWRLNVLKRVKGEVLSTPANNYFETVTDISQPAWEKALSELKKIAGAMAFFFDTITAGSIFYSLSEK